ncbi:uncharacterized protein [Ptychodera flava]|uniref:uncharacterized protein n=1 Tax=Ptychodera flava TaxID=63121 RepID=UPI00396A3DDA
MLPLQVYLGILLNFCLTAQVVHSLECYWCTYSLTAGGEIGAQCKDDPPATDKIYSCPTDEDRCALYVHKVNGHIVDLRRYCSINCQPSCTEEDDMTDYKNMADGVCYRCCRDDLCNGRWEDRNSSAKLAMNATLVFLSIVISAMIG